MTDLLILCLASFAAGALNAIAGGGTFLTLPALVWMGVPAVSANATATLVALPGYIASAWAFRHDIRQQGSLPLRSVIVIGVFGGLSGAILLIMTSEQAFSGIVPWLLLISTLMFAAGPTFTRTLASRGIPAAGPIVSAAALVSVSIYGGYFNGGLGIMLLATFGLLGFTDLHAMNGLKNVLSAILSLTSVAAFIIAGLIVWDVTIPMAFAATAGGYIGARMSRLIKNTNIIRVFVVLVGAVMTLLFFVG
jgi:hypothetical protein